jgi:hypothetical protein
MINICDKGRLPMKILIISDQESSYLWDFFDPTKFRDIDLVISCGDLKASYLSFLVTMIPVPLIYVHGNHDYRYFSAPPEGCVSIENEVFCFKGLKIGGLGGSIEYSGGPCQFSEKVMEKRVRRFIKTCKKKGGLDIFVSHSPTLGLGDGTDFSHKGFKCFYKIYDECLPKFHLFGHEHLSYAPGAKRILNYKNITLINGFNYYILEI